MNISITGLDGLKDSVLAAGIKELLRTVDSAIAVSIESKALPAVALAAPLAEPAPIAKTPRGRKPAKAAAVKAVSARVKPTKTAPATSGGADARGSIRDAVRATLNASGKDTTTILQDVQRTFPEKNRDYVGTVLCQLAKGGECEMGSDGKWRKSE